MFQKRKNQLTELTELARTKESSSRRKLKEYEYRKMIELLMKSCQSSLNRVRDKKRKDYYGLEHQFHNAFDMTETLIGLDWFMKEWERIFLNYSRAGRVKKLSQRPTIGRIDHNKGYLIENIQAESYGFNVSKAKSKSCIITVVKESLSDVNTGSSYYKIVKCSSLELAIKTVNGIIHYKTRLSDYSGNIEKGLAAKIGDYSISIQSEKLSNINSGSITKAI
ncbi:hypothetical protein [Paenibacillus sp. MMO-58]|uniref:hypothetical protein n=1 Tax=Paenibacillus sp. MMO-58 TaxID=3081290 RepID=UPI00301B0C57